MYLAALCVCNASYIGTLLLGSWSAKTRQYLNNYAAGYTSDPTNTDKETIKKVPCDVVRNIEVGIRGRKDYVESIMQGLDMQELIELIKK